MTVTGIGNCSEIKVRTATSRMEIGGVTVQNYASGL